jgi:hypothetical protein
LEVFLNDACGGFTMKRSIRKPVLKDVNATKSISARIPCALLERVQKVRRKAALPICPAFRLLPVEGGSEAGRALVARLALEADSL